MSLPHAGHPSRRIELLAPARDPECGIAAIDSGADAVYIGAPRFGAREAAGNSLEEIAALVRHAHTYWARVYVTLNTLLRDEEIPAALELIARLYEVGIDGLIIQDVGLLECDLPPLPLIASTQMHNHTPERVAFLEQVGIQRVILARELTLEEIGAIRRQTSVELECFVHGALCVSYSGQCYLSYALGGRSGNRGQCAQPCRKAYDLVDGTGQTLARGKHLLSLRDLNLSDHLRELLLAGVSSLKIEGRLKDRAYVANVVAHYRARLDAVLAELGLRRRSSGTSRPDFAPDVSKTFNRGYTTYFLHGRSERIGAIHTPKMVGEPVGRVATVTARGITLETPAALGNGDGICFFDRDGELRGTLVHGMRGDLVLLGKTEGLAVGARVYRNRDHEFLGRLQKSQVPRRIAATLTLRETEDGLALSAVDEDGCTAEFALPWEKAPAEKPEAALESIRRQLAKTGGTPFECRVEIALPVPLFVPIGTLNALRRGALEALAAAREGQRPRESGGARRNATPYPARTLTFEANALNRHAEAFYRRHGVTALEPAAESGLDLRGRRVMTTRYCIKHQLGLCPKETPAAAKGTGRLALVDAERHRLALRFDCARCHMEVYLGEPDRNGERPAS